MDLANGDTNKFFSLSQNDDDRYYVEDFNTDEESYNNYVAILSNEVPKGSVVLDIGCAQGKFGYGLSKRNCVVYGIEQNAASAKHAIESGHYKDIFIFDISSTEGNEYNRFKLTVGQVDAIIIADVLEHMSDPTSILFSYLDVLKEGGILLVSVPNVAHADIYLKLMNGIFNYTDLGILDNTHLKFFTKKSFVEWIDLFNQCYPEKKIDCEYLGSSFYYSDYLSTVRENQKLLFQILERYPEFNALQLFFKLRRLHENESAENLKNALSEKEIDVVQILGSAIEGTLNDRSDKLPALLRSERAWYDYVLIDLKEKLGSKDWEISQKEQRIQALLNYVSDLENEVKKEGASITDLNGYVKELEVDTNRKDNRINDLVKYVSELENELRRKVEIESYINELKESSAQKDKRIEDLLKYTSELESEVKKEEASLAALDVYLKELKENSDQKNNRIEALLKYVSDLENEVKKKAENQITLEGIAKELTENINQKDKKIEELSKYIFGLETEITRHETCIADANNLLTQLNEKLSTKEEEYRKNEAEAETRMEKLAEDLRTARKTIFDMENSVSWRVTKILRSNK